MFLKKDIVKTDYFEIIDKKSIISSELIEWSIANGNFRHDKYKGEGFTAMVLDTGVDPYHKNLKGNIIAKSMIDNNSFDENGHGTFCCGLIADNQGKLGVAPKAQVISSKVIHGDARDARVDFSESISKSIYYAINSGVNVISMSIGFQNKNQKIEKAINDATNKGIICVAAAGNEGMIGSPYKSYPASYENVISVGSANKQGMPSWFTTSGIGDNKHEQPEIAISSKEFFWGLLPNNMYGKMIGTSMATPVVAGLALLWLEAMTINNQDINRENALYGFRQWLIRNAKNTNNNVWDSTLGFGVLLLDEKEDVFLDGHPIY